MSFGPVNGIKVVIARATSKVRELTKSKLKRKSMKLCRMIQEKERNDTYKVYDKNRFEKIIRLSRVNK